MALVSVLRIDAISIRMGRTSSRICPALWSLLPVTMCLAACGEADGPESRVHVIHSAHPESLSCELSFSEELTIGVADYPATHAIGEIIAWAAGDDGYTFSTFPNPESGSMARTEIPARCRPPRSWPWGIRATVPHCSTR